MDTVQISYSQIQIQVIYFTCLYTKPHATTIYMSLEYSWPQDGASYLVKFSITIERIGSVISY